MAAGRSSTTGPATPTRRAPRSALHLAGGLATDDPAYGRGLAYLKATQRPDGSWHVKSRSKPFQTYFESGFPYKGDQFISMAASSWATAALVLACPKTGS